MVDAIDRCLRHRRICAILQQILKPITTLDFVLETMHLNMCLQHRIIWKWVHGFTEHKSLDAIKDVPTEPWNLVDTIVVYGTVDPVLFFSKF